MLKNDSTPSGDEVKPQRRFSLIPPEVLAKLPGLSGAAAKVAIGLASFMGRDGCFPSAATLGQATGIHREKTIFKALAELERAGVIARNQRPGRSTVFTWGGEPLAETAPGGKCQGLDVPLAESAPPPLAETAPTPLAETAPTPLAETASHNNTKEHYQVTGIKHSSAKRTKAKCDPRAAPPVLEGLGLFVSDARLCQDWPKLITGWRSTCPNIDQMAEIRKAHAWLIENPARQKKNNAAFLGRWLRRAQERSAELHGRGSDEGRTFTPEEVESLGIG